MKKTHLIPLALSLIAAVVYFASVANYVFPGESARLVAAWSGFDVANGGSSYPLMGFFARLLGAGNLIAPICGVLSVLLGAALIMRFIGWRTNSESLAPQRDGIVTIATVFASVVFMLSPGVRFAATHLEPRMFDFMWALAAFAVALPFSVVSVGWSRLQVVAVGAMVGLGACDSALFLTLLPAYFVYVAIIEHSRGRKGYLGVFGFLTVFLVVFLLSLRGFEVNVVDSLKASVAELRGYYTTPGWLFVVLFSLLPFVVALFSSNDAFKRKAGPVQWMFHLAMSFVVILSVATPLSPSLLLEPYGIFPVATSAFAAATAGYLVSYWWMHRKTIIGLSAGGVLAFVIAVTVIWNLFSFNGLVGAFADKTAERILADLGDRTWFVSDGTLDNHLMLAAKRSGKELNLVSLSRDLDTDYLSKLGELVKEKGIGGSKNGELQLSLSLGVLPFVQDWFASDPSVGKDVAIYGAPDLWYSAGITPVPEFLFFGADASRKPDWSGWKEFNNILEAPKGWGSYRDRKVSNPVEKLRFSLRRHMGFVANNRGVYLQDAGKDDEAFAMYELVLNEIDHDNICAIFNEVSMAGAKHPNAVAKQHDLERMLKAAVDDKSRRYMLWRLGSFYGYIRNPDIFVKLGHVWARSGRPGDALSQIRRAIDFVPTDKRSVLLNMMAALYASDNNQRKSRSIYESILKKNDNDHDALIGMMRLELLDGNNSKAAEYLQRAVKSTVDGKQARLEMSLVYLMKNDLPSAKKLLRKAVDIDSKDMQAWSLLAATIIQQIDSAKDEKAKAALQKELENEVVPSMEKQSGGEFNYYLQATKGFVLLKKGQDKRREARDTFLAASRARPDIAATQDLVLGLDISLNDKEGAEQHAKDVLRRNRNAPLANYIMGSLALNRGDYVAAESFLRKAADAPQPVVLALNDLAEVLRRTKNYSEAERYARSAVKSAPAMYVAWETLGSVLMDAGRNLGEAESCIRKACELSKTKNGRDADVRMLISLARVQLRNGDKIHARVTLRKVQARLDELSAFEKQEFEKVQQSAR